MSMYPGAAWGVTSTYPFSRASAALNSTFPLRISPRAVMVHSGSSPRVFSKAVRRYTSFASFGKLTRVPPGGTLPLSGKNRPFVRNPFSSLPAFVVACTFRAVTPLPSA